MSNFRYEEFNSEEVKRKEKQAVCHHKFNPYDCSHSALKCILCDLYVDNLVNLYNAKIEVLENIICSFDDLLSNFGVNHPTFELLIKSGIIDLWVKEKITTYELLKRMKQGSTLLSD
jgi:hypothetical protein